MVELGLDWKPIALEAEIVMHVFRSVVAVMLLEVKHKGWDVKCLRYSQVEAAASEQNLMISRKDSELACQYSQEVHT